MMSATAFFMPKKGLISVVVLLTRFVTIRADAFAAFHTAVSFMRISLTLSDPSSALKTVWFVISK